MNAAASSPASHSMPFGTLACRTGAPQSLTTYKVSRFFMRYFTSRIALN
jgi:hypothetical protein